MDIYLNEERPEPMSSQNTDLNDKPAGRPFVGIHFKCCNIYKRVYKNRVGDAYEGACPRCFKKVKLPIGSGGTSNRFFEAE
jgi:hypothetical protein